MEASLGFFEVVLIVVLSFYLLGWISRLLVPVLAKAYMRRLSKRFGFQMPEQDPPKSARPGKVTLNQGEHQVRKGNLDNVGEYADYEEIKE